MNLKLKLSVFIYCIIILALKISSRETASVTIYYPSYPDYEPIMEVDYGDPCCSLSRLLGGFGNNCRMRRYNGRCIRINHGRWYVIQIKYLIEC